MIPYLISLRHIRHNDVKILSLFPHSSSFDHKATVPHVEKCAELFI